MLGEQGQEAFLGAPEFEQARPDRVRRGSRPASVLSSSHNSARSRCTRRVVRGKALVRRGHGNGSEFRGDEGRGFHEDVAYADLRSRQLGGRVSSAMVSSLIGTKPPCADGALPVHCDRGVEAVLIASARLESLCPEKENLKPAAFEVLDAARDPVKQQGRGHNDGHDQSRHGRVGDRRPEQAPSAGLSAALAPYRHLSALPSARPRASGRRGGSRRAPRPEKRAGAAGQRGSVRRTGSRRGPCPNEIGRYSRQKATMKTINNNDVECTRHTPLRRSLRRSGRVLGSSTGKLARGPMRQQERAAFSSPPEINLRSEPDPCGSLRRRLPEVEMRGSQ